MVDADTAAVIATLCIGLGHILGFLVIGASTVVAHQVLAALCREAWDCPSRWRNRRERGRAPGRRLPVPRPECWPRLVFSASFYTAPAMGHTAHRAEDAKIIAHRGSRPEAWKTPGWPQAAADNQADIVEADFQGNRGRAFRGQP